MSDFEVLLAKMIDKGCAFPMGVGLVPTFIAHLPQGGFAVIVHPALKGKLQKIKLNKKCSTNEGRVKLALKMIKKCKGSVFIFKDEYSAIRLQSALTQDYEERKD